MKSKIFNFLSNYSSDTLEVDKIIISSFLVKKNIKTVQNQFLQSYMINEEMSSEWIELQKFIKLIEDEEVPFKFEDLNQLFEFVISPADRIVNGAIYTPSNIRHFIVESSLNQIVIDENFKISDIACGCGGFLLTAAEYIRELTGRSYFEIFRDNLFGLDIQEYSMIRTKLLLSILAILNGEDPVEFIFNIYTGDALRFKWQEQVHNFEGFSSIVGNPPYVSCRNLDRNTKEALRNWSVARSGNPDLYIPFFQIALENLRDGGILGFITMNTFFKSLNGRDLRSYFQEHRFHFDIIDFGAQQVFKAKNTYTCICLINKVQNGQIRYFKASTTKPESEVIGFQTINYENLNAIVGWSLDNHENISIIEATGRPFGSLFKTRHGIATLKNSVYIFRPIMEDEHFYYLQSDEIYPIEKGICRNVINSNKLSRPNELEALCEKIIFPYNNEIHPTLLNEETLSSKYPKTYSYLSSKREILDNRDKGEGKYEKWFAFGRTQSLEKTTNKLFFPKYSDGTPSFILNSDPDLLFYNGLAVIADSERKLLLAKKIMQTRLFWYYISSTSKPYSSNYYSLNGNYIKNFGVCDLTEDEENVMIDTQNQHQLDAFFESKYQINI